jgi:hypothetical protein
MISDEDRQFDLVIRNHGADLLIPAELPSLQ